MLCIKILVDSPKEVAINYVTGAFPFDIVTSIPGSIVDALALQQCVVPGPGEDVDSNSPVLKLVRLLKPLRLLKMGKILKIMNLGAVIRYLESVLSIPHELFSMLLTFASTFGVVHVCACCFWLVKENSNTKEDVADFLEGMNVDDTVAAKYVLSCYFILTVCTTVGFGDIGATNMGEQILIMCIMLIGAIVFANLMSNVQNIRGNMQRMARIEEEVSSQARSFLRRQGIPPPLERRVLAWLSFDTPTREEEGSSAAFLGRLPGQLLMEVMSVVVANGKNGNLDQVPLFRDLISGYSEPIMLECFSRMQMKNYYAGDILAAEGIPCTQLYIILQGQVCIEHLHGGRVIHEETRSSSDYLGEWTLMGDDRWVPVSKKQVLAFLGSKDEVDVETKALNLNVIAGRGLKKMDIVGSSDPYVVVQIDEHEPFGKTQFKENTLTPHWNEHFEERVGSEDLEKGQLILKVFDWDRLTTDDLIGRGICIYICTCMHASRACVCARVVGMVMCLFSYVRGWCAARVRACHGMAARVFGSARVK